MPVIRVHLLRVSVVLLQSQAELHASRSGMRASVDAEHNRLLRLVSEQAASLAEKERQLEVSCVTVQLQCCARED
jgi:hypothetical protein